MDPSWERLPKKHPLTSTSQTSRIEMSQRVVKCFVGGAEGMNEEKGSGEGFLLGVAEMN